MKKQILILAFLFALLLAACGGNANVDNLTAENTDVPNANIDASDASEFIDPDIEIVETETGLQYQDLVLGDGAVAEVGSTVSIHYTGWLIDGTEFDSSIDGGVPISFDLGTGYVIPGWDEGLLGMKVGGKRLLVIPSTLAYGETGAGGGLIPPDTTIVFEVELVALPSADDFIVPDIEVVTTDSGLIYQDLVIGEGEVAKVGDAVVMHFKGYLIDGLVFASSVAQQDEPLSFTIGADMMIPGWNEGAIGMKIGGTRLLIIPSELGFGPQGAGGVIPPNAMVILEVELIGIPVVEDFLDPELEVVTLESGVIYQDIVVGEGTTTQAQDAILVNYTGRLVDGTVFYSSEEGGASYVYTLSGGMEIPGWDEGLAGINIGGKRLLIVPSELVTGEFFLGVFPPGSSLIFEVELIGIPTLADFLDPDLDVVTTETGLMFQDTIVGEGATAQEGDIVVVHYTGWLLDGTKFDSSVDRDASFEFTLSQGSVIAGWDEGVVGMNIGGKRYLVIPYDLAYGVQGSGSIPPGATLIFEVELLEIK